MLFRRTTAGGQVGSIRIAVMEVAMDRITWSDWESVGKPIAVDVARPVVHRNEDGRLELFVSGNGGVFNLAQLSPNGRFRPDWRDKDRPTRDVHLSAHAIGSNADGRQEIFGIGSDGALWHKAQLAPNGGWGDWETLSTPLADVAVTVQFTVGRNQDARQELFAVATDGNVWQIFQTAPNGAWSEWRKLGTPPNAIRRPDRITAGVNRDGRQQLFVVGGDAAVWHIQQVAPNVGWGDWQSLGAPRDNGFSEPQDRDLTEPLVQQNADGHLEVFSPGNGAFCNRWQESPDSSIWRHQGWNAKPKPRPDVEIVWLEAARNIGGPRDGHLEVFAIGSDGQLWHAWQIDVAPNWSAWDALGAPPAKIRVADRMTVGTNRDGRLEAFIVGQDSAVWHRAQQR